MSDDNNTPESEMDIDGGDGDDLTNLEIDPDELPEGEEVDPDADIEGGDGNEDDTDDDTDIVAVVDPDATGETAADVATDDDRLNLDDGDEAEVKKRKPREEVDENEMSGTDDEEADLATILAEKLRSSDGLSADDETAPVELDDPTDGTPLLQPRRPDEEHCQQCFLLVRKSAPKCPVDHDLCPLFPTV
ncbi:MAG: hypothetical protein RLZZ518_712 [Actinomycetota bacterium]